VLRAIKQAGLSSTVIVLTSLADPQIRKACLDAGAAYFLDKSSEIEQLPAILRALAEKIPNSSALFRPSSVSVLPSRCPVRQVRTRYGRTV
jgi:DNA-binding NarL/FixJ family response regulator